MADKFHIGLDIGANSIKAIMLGATKTGFFVDKFKTLDFPEVVTENGAVIDYGELVNKVKEVVDESFPNKEVAIALKGPSVLVRKMLVNNDSLGDTGEFRWIADQYACVEPEEMSIAFETLPSQDLYNHTSIVMTAARKDTIIDFVSIMESASLIPKIIESEAMAIVRLYRTVFNKNNIDIHMILHVGYVGSFVILTKNGMFDFCREVSRGGKYFTDMIVHDLDVDSETAESIKINPNNHDDPDKVITTLERLFEIEFIQEVDYILKLYLLRGGQLPDKIFLSGGACQTIGLEKALREKYKVSIEYLDPWEKITIAEDVAHIKDGERYTYNVALGLALHGYVY